MTLTPTERAFLHAACVDGAERRGRTWRAGALTIERSEIGRLIRAGLLLGKRGGHRLTVSRAGRRAVTEGKAPPIGTEVIARGHKASLRGRVIASGPNEATLLPLDGGTWNETAPAVYEVRRPHAGAPWKGRAAPIGNYLDEPIWPALASIVPPIWTAPFTTEPYTLARLREVNAKRAAIGGYCRSVEEQAAAAIVPTYGIPLAGIRAMAEGDHCLGDRPRAEYLAEVVRRDPAPFDAADFAYALQEVKRSIMPYRHNILRDPLLVCSLAEIAKDHRRIRPEMLQRAYACLVPWARDVVDRDEARRAAFEAKWGKRTGSGGAK